MCVTSYFCGLKRWMCLQRYLVAVGGMAFEQQWREQLDQTLSAEDTALLEQKGVLEPAIPQPSAIRREADAAVKRGGRNVGRAGEALLLNAHHCLCEILIELKKPKNPNYFDFVRNDNINCFHFQQY